MSNQHLQTFAVLIAILAIWPSESYGTPQPDNAAQPNEQDSSRDAETERLINLVRAGMQANLDLIQSLDVEMEVEERAYRIGQGDPAERRYDHTIWQRFWFDGVRWRVKWRGHMPDESPEGEKILVERTQDYVYDGKATRSYDEEQGFTTIRSQRDGTNFFPNKHLTFGYRLGNIDWSRSLRQAKSARQTSEGMIQIVWESVQRPYKYTYEIDVDPSRGCLVVAAIGRTETEATIFRRHGAEFHASENGAWLLTAVNDEYYDRDDASVITSKRCLKVSSIVVNEPVAEATFVLNEPTGTRLFNAETGQRSRINNASLPIEQAENPGLWFLVGGLALLVSLVAGIYAFRRIRNRVS